MKVIHNKLLPFGRNFLAINILGVVFTKGHLSGRAQNHERIHTLQQREMLFIFFYLWYAVEWMVKILKYRNNYMTYKNLSFEREAYRHEHDLHYCRHRRLFSWMKYI